MQQRQFCAMLPGERSRVAGSSLGGRRKVGRNQNVARNLAAARRPYAWSNGQNRNGRTPEDALCDGAQERLTQSASTVGTYDDEVRLLLSGKVENALRDIAF